MNDCKCEFCGILKKIKSVCATRKLRDRDALINDLLERWHNAAADENYYAAILEGSWPQSIEILERALAHAKTQQEV